MCFKVSHCLDMRLYREQSFFRYTQSLIAEIHSTTTEFVKAVSKRYNKKQVSEDTKKETHGEASAAAAASDGGKKKGEGFGGLVAEGHYAECYPGGMEEYDATYDSDEDVDFSKMDMVSDTGRPLSL